MLSEGWGQRFDAFNTGQISTTLAVSATNIFPEATPEARQLVTQLAPKDPQQRQQYVAALRFASQLKPEAQKVFTRLYAGDNLSRWSDSKDVLFGQNKVPDIQSVKIIEFWRKKGFADSKLRKTLGDKASRDLAYKHIAQMSRENPPTIIGARNGANGINIF